MKCITKEMLKEMISDKKGRITSLQGYITKEKWLSQTKLSEARKHSIELKEIKDEIVLLENLLEELIES